MKHHSPTLARLGALILLILVALPDLSIAQTSIRTRINDRNRDRNAPAEAQPEPAEPTPAAPKPTAAPAAAPTPPAPASSTAPAMAQNDSSSNRSTVESITSRLPASVMENERAAGVANAVKSRVGDELEGKSTEEVIRAAQQRLSSLRGGGSTTITDVPAAAATATAATAAAAPAAVQAAPVAAPVAAPMTAQPTTPAPPAAATAASTPPATPAATPAADAPRPAAPAPALIASPGEVPAPVPLRPRYEKERSASQAMEIESDESTMDNNQRIVTFQGNVYVNHPEFKLSSDHLEIYLNEESNLDGTQSAAAAKESDDNAPPFKRAIATGGMVEIEKIGADGKAQIAKAKKADYDALTGDIVLSGGPPTLQSGTGFINPSSPDALIILRGSGQHEVKGGTGGRNKFSIPIKGGAKTGTAPLSGSLDSITNRNDNR